MDEKELTAVKETYSSIAEIESKLGPLLELASGHKAQMALHNAYDLKRARDKQTEEPPAPIDNKEVADVSAAIALAISSLYFIRLRLQGVEVTKDHPVRNELKKIRGVMKKLREVDAIDGEKSLIPAKRPAADVAADEHKEREERERERQEEERQALSMKVAPGSKLVGGSVLSQPKKKRKGKK
jgi:hypothetical protein